MPDPWLVRVLERNDLPATFERWRVVLEPGSSRATDGSEWAGCLVLVEHGTIEVDCAAGGHRSFTAGHLLALGWLPLRMLRNPGRDEVRLLAVRRRGRPPPDRPFLHVTRPPSMTTEGEAPAMTFRTVIELGGRTATGIRVPDEVVAGLGAGRRPAVRVTIGSHTYRSTIAVMGGAFMLPLSAENREAAGVAAGDEIEVLLALDTAPREVTVPADLAAALAADPEARHTFEGLSYSNQRWHVESIAGAKTEETRQRRIAKSVASLHEGRPR